MRLLEYQAKELFKEFGIRTPPSISSTDIEKGRKDAKELGYPFVIKVQVPVGGRGKAGGIQKCNSCILYTSPSPRDKRQSRMPSSA